MESDKVLPDRTVLVQGGKIVAVGTAREVPLPKDALPVDGSGKYLMPGLADLHVHLFSSDDLVSYAAYGVTTVLNMDGSPAHLKWREQVRTGTLLGPTIYTASHTMDGYPPLNEMFLTAEKPGDADAYVRESKRMGYDFIKLYGTLRPDVFRAILETAAEESIPVVGHINRQAGALEVLKSKQVLAAHLEDLLFARFDHVPTDAELEEFANAIAASHITVTPNLNVNPTNVEQLKNLDGVLKSPEARLLPPAAYSQWMPSNNRNERNDQTAQQIESTNGIEKMLYHMVTLLNARGVRMVLGTDAAPFGFPGFSAHQELEELVEAGFTPYQALLTATRNAGAFVAENVPSAPRFGTIANGTEADLLLLSANPLIDIRNCRKIDGVMLKGQWLPSSRLGELLSSAQKHSIEIKQQLEKIDTALEAGDVAQARKLAAPLASEASPWIAEWVLMSKARKLQSGKREAAIQIARWNAELYPQSYSTYYVLADLLFQSGNLDEALAQAKKSEELEPHNAATLNLLEKIRSVHEAARFVPAGTYKLQYTNDQTGEVQSADLIIHQSENGSLAGNKMDGGGDSSALLSVYAGGNRLWVLSDSNFGPVEFRITVNDKDLAGSWAAPFGRNGKLVGRKIE